jgi:hypothetical protein
LRTSELRLAAQCFIVLVLVRIALHVLPYRRLRNWFPEADAQEDSRFYARRVAYHVRRGARWVPAASCLTQALAAKYILARAGHRSMIRVGVRKDSCGKVEAHAWLICDRAIVLGGRGEDLAQYVPLTDLD